MPDQNLILLRLGAELAIKARRTRSSFLRQLRRNLRDALSTTDASWQLEGEWSRIYVRSDSPETPALLGRVFGISSLSPVELAVPARLEEIVRQGEAAFAGVVRGKRFAVRAHRTGVHDFHSRDVMVQLGAALLPHALRVDL